MNVALYARVSTLNGQDPEVQLVPLRAHVAQRGWQVAEEFVDIGISGSKDRRPALDRMMKAAWDGKFQAVLVWRFDRFARCTKHLITALETFRSVNVSFVSLQEQFDLSSPIGAAMFTIIGAMGQLERDLVIERVRAGLDRARAKGVRLGRPRVAVDIGRVVAMRSEGKSIRAVGRALRISPMSVRRALAELPGGTKNPASDRVVNARLTTSRKGAVS
jgi:DNA invertase Pin-like site-specific DNA recombinase